MYKKLQLCAVFLVFSSCVMSEKNLVSYTVWCLSCICVTLVVAALFSQTVQPVKRGSRVKAFRKGSLADSPNFLPSLTHLGKGPVATWTNALQLVLKRSV